MSDLPVPTDPMSSAIEKGIEEAAKAAKDYLDKLVVPGLEQGGGIIGDTVAYWRFKNKVNLVLKAKAFLEAKGIEPKRLLPGITLFGPAVMAGLNGGPGRFFCIFAALSSSRRTGWRREASPAGWTARGHRKEKTSPDLGCLP